MATRQNDQETVTLKPRSGATYDELVKWKEGEDGGYFRLWADDKQLYTELVDENGNLIQLIGKPVELKDEKAEKVVEESLKGYQEEHKEVEFTRQIPFTLEEEKIEATAESHQTTGLFEIRPELKDYEVGVITTKTGDRQNVLVWSNGKQVLIETIDDEGTKVVGGQYQSVREIQSEAEIKNAIDEEFKKLEQPGTKVNRGLYFILDSEGNPLITGEGKPKDSVAILFTPTVVETDESRKTWDATDPHRSLVGLSGYFDLDIETAKTLKDAGVITDDFKGDEITTALRIHSLGGKSEDFSAKIEAAKFLTEEEKKSLHRSSYIVATLEETETELTKNLQTAFRHPEIVIEQTNPQTRVPQFQGLVLERNEDGLSPILERVIGEARQKATEGVKKAAGKVLGPTTNAAKSQVKKLAVSAVKTGGKKVLAKGGLAVVKSGLAVALGIPTGGLGTIATLIVSEIVGKILSLAKNVLSSILRFFTGEEDFRKQLLYLTAALAIILMGLGLAIPALIAGALALGALISIMGGLTLLAGAAGVVQAFIIVLITVIIAVGAPVIMAAFGFRLTVIFIIIIINNSAFVVPFGGFNTGTQPPEESVYIDVTKEATPPGPFGNNQQISVSYTITITAELGDLTNFIFTYDCQVYTDHNQDCPPATNIRAGPEGGPFQNFPTFQAAIPPVIPAGTSYVIMYDVIYSAGNFDDSLITDTFTVEADALGGARSQESGVETITIGNPPNDCFIISNAGSPWPTQYRNNVQAAITTLVSRYPNFSRKACSGGDIPICYGGASPDGRWGDHNGHGSSCDIKLYTNNDGTPNNYTDVLYVLTHEIGHHISHVAPAYFLQYRSYAGIAGELPLCNNTVSTDPPQVFGFCDSSALYISGLSMSRFRNCSNQGITGPFPNVYPRHASFVQNVMLVP